MQPVKLKHGRIEIAVPNSTPAEVKDLAGTVLLPNSSRLQDIATTAVDLSQVQTANDYQSLVTVDAPALPIATRNNSVFKTSTAPEIVRKLKARERSVAQVTPKQFSSLAKLLDEDSNVVFKQRAHSIQSNYTDLKRLDSQSSLNPKLLSPIVLPPVLQTPSIHRKEVSNLQVQVMEDWLNKTLEIKEGEPYVYPRKYVSNQSACNTYGISLELLQKAGMSLDNARSVQKSLYVHSVGMFHLIKENTKNCQNRYKVCQQIWVAFQALLDRCCKSKTQTLIYQVSKELDKQLTEKSQKFQADLLQEQHKQAELRDDIRKLRDTITQLEHDVSDSRADINSLTQQIQRQQADGEQSTLLRQEAEAKLTQLLTNQRMQELRLRQLGHSQNRNEDYHSQLLQTLKHTQAELKALVQAKIDAEVEVRNAKEELRHAQASFLLDIRGFTQLKQEHLQLQDTVGQLKSQVMEYEKSQQLDRIKVAYVTKDNQSLLTTAQTYKSSIDDQAKEIEILKKLTTSLTQQHDVVKQALHEHRAEHVQAHTSTLNAKQAWLETNQKLEATTQLLAKTQALLKAEQSQTAKLTQRKDELLAQQKDVAAHVHQYYGIIRDQERTIEQERLLIGDWERRYKLLEKRFVEFQLKDHTQVAKQLIEKTKDFSDAQAKLIRQKKEHEIEIAKLRQQIKDMAELNITEQTLKREAQSEVQNFSTEIVHIKSEWLEKKSEQIEIKSELQKALNSESLTKELIQPLEARVKSLALELLISQQRLVDLQTEYDAYKITQAAVTASLNQEVISLKEEITQVRQPFVQLSVQQAMAGEEYRSRCVEILSRLELQKRQTLSAQEKAKHQDAQIRKLTRALDSQKHFQSVIVENLYGLQRLQQERSEEQSEQYRAKCEEADELSHEVTRLGNQKLPQKIVKHQTKQTQATDPELTHVGVQNAVDCLEAACQSANKTFDEAYQQTKLDMQWCSKNLGDVKIEELPCAEVQTEWWEPERVEVCRPVYIDVPYEVVRIVQQEQSIAATHTEHEWHHAELVRTVPLSSQQEQQKQTMEYEEAVSDYDGEPMTAKNAANEVRVTRLTRGAPDSAHSKVQIQMAPVKRQVRGNGGIRGLLLGAQTRQ